MTTPRRAFLLLAAVAVVCLGYLTATADAQFTTNPSESCLVAHCVVCVINDPTKCKACNVGYLPSRSGLCAQQPSSGAAGNAFGSVVVAVVAAAAALVAATY